MTVVLIGPLIWFVRYQFVRGTMAVRFAADPFRSQGSDCRRKTSTRASCVLMLLASSR